MAGSRPTSIVMICSCCYGSSLLRLPIPAVYGIIEINIVPVVEKPIVVKLQPAVGSTWPRRFFKTENAFYSPVDKGHCTRNTRLCIKIRGIAGAQIAPLRTTNGTDSLQNGMSKHKLTVAAFYQHLTAITYDADPGAKTIRATRHRIGRI